MAVALATSLLLPARGARAQEYHPWTSCSEYVALPLASSLGIAGDLCSRYTFVRGRTTATAAELLYLVARTSAPVRLSSGQPLVFLDVESAVPTLTFAVDAGGPRMIDVLGLWRLRRATGSPADLPTASSTTPGLLAVELLVDAELFDLARRLGVFFPRQDGTVAFAELAVLQVPELNVLVFSAQLTELGRAFFRAFRDQGIAGLDALLGWRVVRSFTPGGVEASSTGWFPCVRAGPRVTSRAQLARIDPVLLTLPIDLSNVTQMVNCQ